MALTLTTQAELEDLLADNPRELLADVPRMHWAHVAIAFVLVGCGAFLISAVYHPDVQARMPVGWVGLALRCVPPAMLSYGLTTIGKSLGYACTRAFAYRMLAYGSESLGCAERWRDTARWYADLAEERGMLPECELCPNPARNRGDDKPRCDRHMLGDWTGIAADWGP